MRVYEIIDNESNTYALYLKKETAQMIARQLSDEAAYDTEYFVIETEVVED